MLFFSSRDSTTARAILGPSCMKRRLGSRYIFSNTPFISLLISPFSCSRLQRLSKGCMSLVTPVWNLKPDRNRSSFSVYPSSRKWRCPLLGSKTGFSLHLSANFLMSPSSYSFIFMDMQMAQRRDWVGSSSMQELMRQYLREGEEYLLKRRTAVRMTFSNLKGVSMVLFLVRRKLMRFLRQDWPRRWSLKCSCGEITPQSLQACWRWFSKLRNCSAGMTQRLLALLLLMYRLPALSPKHLNYCILIVDTKMEQSEYACKYEEIELLGRCYQDDSSLFLIKQKQPPSQYRCAKKISLYDSKGHEDQLLNEISLLKTLSHPHVIRYYDVCLEGDELVSILEFCEQGDLHSYLQKHRNRKELLSEKLILCWLMQLLMALEHLHSKNIVHRLVDARNVYLNHQGDLKIGSFGNAKVLQNTMKKAVTVITEPCNMSPEMVEGKPYDSKVDIWALGCLLYELASLQPMHKFGNLVQLYDLIVEKASPELPVKYAKHLNPIFRKMMKKNPSARPSASELLQEEVFINIMKEYVKKKKIDSLDLKYMVPKILNIHRKRMEEKGKEKEKEKGRVKLPPLSNSKVSSVQEPSSSPKTEEAFKKSKNSSLSKGERQGSKEKLSKKEGSQMGSPPVKTKPGNKKALDEWESTERSKSSAGGYSQEEQAIPQRISSANLQSGSTISKLCEEKLQMILKKYKPNMSQIYEQTMDFDDLF